MAHAVEDGLVGRGEIAVAAAHERDVARGPLDRRRYERPGRQVGAATLPGDLEELHGAVEALQPEASAVHEGDGTRGVPDGFPHLARDEDLTGPRAVGDAPGEDHRLAEEIVAVAKNGTGVDPDADAHPSRFLVDGHELVQAALDRDGGLDGRERRRKGELGAVPRAPRPRRRRGRASRRGPARGVLAAGRAPCRRPAAG